MKLQQLVVPKEKIEKELEAFRQLIRNRKQQLLTQIHKDLRRIYGHMYHGGKVIDVYESFRKAGLNEDGDPRLAIARADGVFCYCVKRDDGSAVYSIQRFKWDATYSWYSPRKCYGEIMLPKGTFNFPKDSYGHVRRQHIQCPVPIVPTTILADLRYALRNYHIIWEVSEWKPTPPKDPILVKMVTPNIALVLATWNLTRLERAVIMGRL
ncbi:MAG TPA: hypothetical protein ENF90_00920 [Candidatus Bathyarchaeota archaeon]|nr:hypothetical protein [Candidatus Bathyarchaeota archaeon]